MRKPQPFESAYLTSLPECSQGHTGAAFEIAPRLPNEQVGTVVLTCECFECKERFTEIYDLKLSDERWYLSPYRPNQAR